MNGFCNVTVGPETWRHEYVNVRPTSSNDCEPSSSTVWPGVESRSAPASAPGRRVVTLTVGDVVDAGNEMPSVAVSRNRTE